MRVSLIGLDGDLEHGLAGLPPSRPGAAPEPRSGCVSLAVPSGGGARGTHEGRREGSWLRACALEW